MRSFLATSLAELEGAHTTQILGQVFHLDSTMSTLKAGVGRGSSRPAFRVCLGLELLQLWRVCGCCGDLASCWCGGGAEVGGGWGVVQEKVGRADVNGDAALSRC